MSQFKLLDTVTNLAPIPSERLTLLESDYQFISNLPKGQVGTIVEVYKSGNQYQYLVEFADTQGCEYALAILQADEILILNYELNIA